MSNDFLTGLATGVPVGIATDMLGRPLHRLFDRRLETRETVRARRVEAAIGGDSQRLRDWIVLQVLETTLVGALVGIAAGFIFGIFSLVHNPPDWLPAIGQGVAVVGAVVVFRIAGDAIAVSRSMGVRFKKSEDRR